MFASCRFVPPLHFSESPLFAKSKKGEPELFRSFRTKVSSLANALRPNRPEIDNNIPQKKNHARERRFLREKPLFYGPIAPRAAHKKNDSVDQKLESLPFLRFLGDNIGFRMAQT